MYSSYCFSPRRSKSDLGLCTSCFCAMTALCSTVCSVHVCAMGGGGGTGERESFVEKAESLFVPGTSQSSVSSWAEPALDLGQPPSPLGVPGDVLVFCSRQKDAAWGFCERIFLCFPWQKVFASRYFAHPSLSNRLQPSRVTSLWMLSTFSWFACLLSYFLWEKDQKKTNLLGPSLKRWVYMYRSFLLQSCWKSPM